jgi:hypothetical protein
MVPVRLGVAVLATAVSGLGGCVAPETPVARAADVVHHECRARTSAREDDALLAATLPLRTEAYCNYDACSGAAQVFGVRIFVRPPPGVSAQRLALAVQCHNARALLQPSAAMETSAAADPYRLPDIWVSDDVAASADGMVVTLSGDSIADNIRLRHHVETMFEQQRTPGGGAAIPR